MLKIRIIPILTFNGFGLVKTKNFTTPRMVGNPVQAARVYNSRGVDELVFLDIFASEQGRKINLKLVSDILKECYMPVAIGGGIKSIEDINSLLKIGADKVVIKSMALTDSDFIKEAVGFFGSQCISIALDAYRSEKGYLVYTKTNKVITITNFIKEMNNCGIGEFVVTSVDKEGLMQGYDSELVKSVMLLTNLPVIAVGGCGTPEDCKKLVEETGIEAIGASSIFHFTQYTPRDIKESIRSIGKPVRL